MWFRTPAPGSLPRRRGWTSCWSPTARRRRWSGSQKLKEVKFHVNIDDHDYQTKLKHALDFLEKGCRLKITLALRGREMAHQDLAFQLMDQVMAALAPYADADGKPKMLGRNISVNFAPK